MSGRLKDEIQSTKGFSSLEEEVYLNLQRSAGLLMQALAQQLKAYGLTPTQYNVLRILRGAHPEGLTCGEIGSRLVTPEPDVTRLLDRLVKQSLLHRDRDKEDRRMVRSWITEEGLHLLARLDEPVSQWHRQRLSHLGDEGLEMLIGLLELARERIG